MRVKVEIALVVGAEGQYAAQGFDGRWDRAEVWEGLRDELSLQPGEPCNHYVLTAEVERPGLQEPQTVEANVQVSGGGKS